MSKRFTLNKADLMAWGRNTLLFFAPAIIIFLGALRAGADMKDALYLVYLWGIDVVIDLIRKWSAGK